jgi:TRAP-type C4-dicarboxylate transport system permease small subunit
MPQEPSRRVVLDADFFAIPLNWQRWWTIVPEIVILGCAGLLPVVVMANVVARYTNWFHVFWAEDVVRVLFMWIVFLGGAVAVKYKAHVRMSTLSDRLARSGAAGARWGDIIRLSPIMVGAILLILGVPIVEISMRRELPTLGISVGYFTTIIPVSGALMVFYALRSFRVGGAPQPDSSPL